MITPYLFTLVLYLCNISLFYTLINVILMLNFEKY